MIDVEKLNNTDGDNHELTEWDEYKYVSYFDEYEFGSSREYADESYENDYSEIRNELESDESSGENLDDYSFREDQDYHAGGWQDMFRAKCLPNTLPGKIFAYIV